MTGSGDTKSEGVHTPSDDPTTPIVTPLVVGMDALGAMIVLGMMVIVNIDVFGRWLFNSPLPGTFELTEMGIVAVVYLQLAHTVRARRLTRSDTLLNFLSSRGARSIDQFLRMAFNIVGAGMLTGDRVWTVAARHRCLDPGILQGQCRHLYRADLASRDRSCCWEPRRPPSNS